MNTGHIPGLVSLPFTRLHEIVDGDPISLVTDDHLRQHAALESSIGALPADPIVIPVGEPSTDTVTAVSDQLRGSESNIVVAFGGGSVIDTTKLAAVVSGSDRAVWEYLGTGVTDMTAGRRVIAVPTTSGSGAEVTRTCVVTHEGRKRWAWNDRLRPATILVDPSLTHSLPVGVTVSTGLDAFVHGLEAATSPNSDPDAVTSGAAAVEAIFEALPRVVVDGGDHGARSLMMDAALCAGYAIDRAGTGIGHGVGHALATMTPIPHGLAVSFAMAACLEWGMETAAARYLTIDPEGDLIDRVKALLDAVQHSEHLQRWVTAPLDAGVLASELTQPDHRPMCLNNARPMLDADVGVVASRVVAEWNALLR